MTIDQLTDDSKAILLLCGMFGGKNGESSVKPLTLKEYNVLVQWLIDRKLRPGMLLRENGRNVLVSANDLNLDNVRIEALLDRGAALAFATEKWLNKGLWVISRSDKAYPQVFRDKLKLSAPPFLFGAGDADLLNKGGLAVVGSRDIDDEACKFTRYIAKTCARQNMQIISGGARGADQESMMAALHEGGTAAGVLADGLLKAAVSGKYRQPLRDGTLVLVSPYNPESRFNVGNAMERNKYIYALANYSLVISTAYNKGGTWSGAIEELRKDAGIPVFVRTEGNIPDGNKQLLKKGAKSFPESPWDRPLCEIMAEAGETVMEPEQLDLVLSDKPRPVRKVSEDKAEYKPESASSHEQELPLEPGSNISNGRGGEI